MSGTAEVHPEATLTPSKLELVTAWLPTQNWFVGTDAADAKTIASFRFVDPDGEVGIETLIVRASDGTTYQVPLTYRSGPLEGSDDYLVGHMQHSLLGQRWVYDATGDPVYVDEVIRVIREADTEADLSVDRPKTMTVIGSGVVLVSNSLGQVRLHRVIDPESDAKAVGIGVLEGTWTEDGREHTAVLATLY